MRITPKATPRRVPEGQESFTKRSLVVLVCLLVFLVIFGFHFEAQALEEGNKQNFDYVTVEGSGNNHTTNTNNQNDNDNGGGNDAEVEVIANNTPKQENENENENENTAEVASGNIRANAKPTLESKKDGLCTLDCSNLSQKRQEQFNGNLSNRQAMLDKATQARESMVSQIKKHYGDNFDSIFQFGFQPASPTGESAIRLERKLQIKALEVQLKFQEEESICQKDCQLLLNPNPSPIYETTDPYYERYVWATGGHSAAAGHGNLFNESYTAFLERDMKPVFAAIGMEFEGRNFAMGGTRSGLEIAMCFEQIFGSDVDFFSWDYGMTDGRKDSLLFHYGYRGALNPGRPAMLGVWTNGWRGRDDRLYDLEELGLTTFNRPTKNIEGMNAAFPDSGEMTESQLQALPDYVRNFKCQGQIEKGDPHCSDEKYSKGICDDRASKAGWHPGIKQHGVDGHMLAMFLSENLIKALQALVDHKNQDAESLLKTLREEEDELMERIRTSHLGDGAWKIYDAGKLEELDPDVDLELLYKGKSICHTARTPAITRFMGYLTNTDKVGGIAPYGSEQYDTGIEKSEADKTDANGQMRLVWEFNPKDRQTCEVPLRPDYKDSFYTHHRDGLIKLNFPNEKEKAAYKYDQSQMKGVIILILNECDWGKCEPGDLKYEDVEEGNVKIEINSVDVTKVVSIGSGCLILKHKGGIHWEPSRNDDYEIAVKVMAPDSYLRISSVVIY